MRKPTLVLGEICNGKLSYATRATITALTNTAHGERWVLWLLGPSIPQSVQEEAKCIEGLCQLWLSEDTALHPLHTETLAETILAKRDHYHSIFTAATTWGKALLPRLAALLDCEQQSNITALDDTSVKRCLHGGNVVATLKPSNLQNRWMATICQSAFAPVAIGDRRTIEVIVQPACVPQNIRSEAKGAHQVASTQSLQQADIVVAGGRGIGSRENFDKLAAFAKSIGAALGASRAAVDAGFVANAYQVGQTGQIVSPKLYLAFGISGATQHTAGMSESGTIVAINTNPQAPIFEIADYHLVMDWAEAIEKLAPLLALRTQQQEIVA